jgi:hypothetical protein
MTRLNPVIRIAKYYKMNDTEDATLNLWNKNIVSITNLSGESYWEVNANVLFYKYNS